MQPEFEFEAIPLSATQSVRVRFHHIGPLPPMDLEDEVPVESRPGYAEAFRKFDAEADKLAAWFDRELASGKRIREEVLAAVSGDWKSQEIDIDAAVAWLMEPEDSTCEVVSVMSNVCVRGTRSCIADHTSKPLSTDPVSVEATTDRLEPTHRNNSPS